MATYTARAFVLETLAKFGPATFDQIVARYDRKQWYRHDPPEAVVRDYVMSSLRWLVARGRVLRSRSLYSVVTECRE